MGSLGTVDSKFALALEIAAGNKMKGVVVKDDSVAAECIKYLRTNKFGVATFLPLNKVKARPKDPEVDKLSRAQGCYGYAGDLIKYDAKYRGIFSYVFGNTLVVDSIDAARRIV